MLVVDCQSTGATPAHGHLLELGWTVTTGAAEEAEHHSRVIALPPGERIPRLVSKLTGIRTADMATAIEAGQAWAELSAAAGRAAEARQRPRALAVAHFARFEERFVADLHGRFGNGSPVPLEWICTYELARRLLPTLPRQGLRAVAGYFGFPVTQLRRSSGHVAANAFVWRNVLRLLGERGVHTAPQLHRWLAEVPVPGRGREYPMPRETRLAVPDHPGVYRMLRRNGDILYIGKATSLRRRVNSHFTKKRGVGDRALEMLSQAQDVHVTLCSTALEAAILETDEIKAHRPPYNAALIEGDRRVGFVSRDFRSTGSAASGVHRVGPLWSPTAVAGLSGLADILASGDLSAARISQALSVPPSRAPAAEIFAEGLGRFRTTYLDGAAAGVDALLRVGTALWAEVRASAAEPDAEPAPQAADETDWDPDKVLADLIELVASSARLVRRAHWLCRLSESVVAWRPAPDAARRYLVVEAGHIAEQGDLAEDRPLPVPSGHRQSARARRRCFDLATYDRLRVLTTELRRAANEVPGAAVRFGPREHLGGARLLAALEWV